MNQGTIFAADCQNLPNDDCNKHPKCTYFNNKCYQSDEVDVLPEDFRGELYSAGRGDDVVKAPLLFRIIEEATPDDADLTNRRLEAAKNEMLEGALEYSAGRGASKVINFLFNKFNDDMNLLLWNATDNWDLLTEKQKILIPDLLKNEFLNSDNTTKWDIGYFLQQIDAAMSRGTKALRDSQ